jgi:filamentous hemagglutinin family protein
MNRRHLLSTACWLAATPALANPQGGHVVQGSATISSPNANTLDVKQTSEDAVINWQSFSIGAGQTTQFQQPNAGAVTLDRVTGANLSQIAGTLRANGTVILINQSGIVFSQGAQVDTGGLIATTADITKPNFASGHLAFNKPSRVRGASVINRGTITVAQAGLAALVAPSVANSGVISATLGRVVLGGAKTFTADLYGDGLVSFDVTSRVAEAANSGALVSNSGQITADGGHILLTADAVDGIIGDLVDAGGTVQAQSVGGRAGNIALQGQGSGIVSVTGTLDASGQAAGQKGGTVSVLGNRVGLLAGASIDVSGAAGGGLVLVGGNFHGHGPQQRAQITYVDAAAHIAADGLGGSSGGSVAIWSGEQTAFYGTISARGGALGGDGGYVEVSGENLDFSGIVDRSAPHGAAGTLLLDPAVVNIDDVAGTPNNNNLLPTILASEDPGATDHITVQGIETSLEGGNVSIAATGSINVNSAISNSTTFGFSLTLQAPTINVAADISNGFGGFGGNLSLLGSVVLASSTGTVNLSAGGNLSLGPTSGPDVLNLAAGGTATLNGAQVASLFTDGAVSLVLNAGTYTATNGFMEFDSPATTSGTLTLGSSETFFYGSITLASNTVLDATAGGGFVYVGSVDATSAYAQGLTILAAAGGAEIAQAGTAEPLSTLSVTGPATLGPQVDPGAVINAHSVLLPGSVFLNEDTAITTDASGTIVLGSISSFSNNGNSLSLSAGTGGITLNGLEVQSLTYTSAGPVTLGGGSVYDIIGATGGYTFGAVTLSGDYQFSQPTNFGAVTLTGNTNFYSGAGTTVDLDLASVNSSGAAPFNVAFFGGALSLGSVGAVHPVGVLTVDANGNTLLSGNITAQSVAMTSPVTLTAAITVDAPGGASFGTVDGFGTNFGVFGALNFTSGSGNVTLGTIGGNIPINSLTDQSAASTVTLTGNVAAGSVYLPGPVALAGDTTIDTTSAGSGTGPITLGTVSGPNFDLFLSAGGGTITLSGLDVLDFGESTTGPTFLGSGTYTAAGGDLTFGTVTTNGSLTLGSSNDTVFTGLILASDTVLDGRIGGGDVAIDEVDAKTAYGQGLTILVADSQTASSLIENAGASAPLKFIDIPGDTNFGYTQSSGSTATINTGSLTAGSDYGLYGAAVIITTNASGSIELGNPTSANAEGSLTLTAGSGGITLGGIFDNAVSLSSSGPIRLNQGFYDIFGATAGYTFGNVTTSGTITFAQTTTLGAVTLAANTNFRVQGGGDVTIGSLDSASASAPINVFFTSITNLTLGSVGAINPVGSLTAQGVGTTFLNGDVNARSVAIIDPVTLSAAVTVDAPGGATFNTVDGFGTNFGVVGALKFTADSGNVTLGTVGGNVPLNALSDASTASTVTLTGGVEAGSVSLPGAVVLAGLITIDTVSNGSGTGPITLGPVTGTSLGLSAGGGAITLSGLDVQAFSESTTGLTYLNSGTYTATDGLLPFGNVVTSGTLTLGSTRSDFNAITLAADTVLDATAAGGGIFVGDAEATTAYGQSLKILVAANGPNATIELDNAGLVTPLGTLTTSGPVTFGAADGGPVSINADTVNIQNQATLNESTAITTDSGGSITLANIIGVGSAGLTLSAGSGGISLNGVTADSLSISATGTVTLNPTLYDITSNAGFYSFGNVTLEGVLQFAQPTDFAAVLLSGPTIISATPGCGCALDFNSIDSVNPSSPQNATIVDPNISALGIHFVGATNPLGTLTVDIQTTGLTTLHGQVNAQQVNFLSPVDISNSAVVDAPGGAYFAIILSDPTPGAPLSLLSFSGTGNVTLGNVDTPGSTGAVLATSASNKLTLTGDVTAVAVDFGGPVVITGSTTIDTSNSIGTFVSMSLGPISGAGQTLTLNSGSGPISLSGFDVASFSETTTGATTLNGGTYTVASPTLAFRNVATSGDLIFGQPTSFGSVALLSDTTLDSSAVGGALALGQVTGSAALTVNTGSGGVTFDGVDVNALTVNGTGIETLLAGTYAIGTSASFGNVQVGGDIVLASPQTSFASATLVADTTLDSSSVNGNLILGPVSGGTFGLTLDAGTGSIALNGVQAGDFNASAGALTANTGTYNVPGGIDFDGSSGNNTIMTNGTLTLLGGVAQFPAILLQSDTTLIGQVIIGGDTDATTPYGQGLTVQTAAGGEFVFGNIGATTPLNFLTSSAGTSFDGYGTVIDAGSVALANRFVVYGPTSITTNGAGSIVLGDTTKDGGGGLLLSAGSGGVTLNGVVLDSLAINAAGPVSLDSGTYDIGAAAQLYAFGAVSTNGLLRLGQPTSFAAITLAGSTVLDATQASAGLTLGPVAGPFALTVSSGSGGVSFAGVTAAGLTVNTSGQQTLNAGTYTIGSGPYAFGDVTTNGTIVLGQATSFGAVTLASDTVLDTAPVNADLSFGAVTGQGFALEAVAGQGSVSAGAIDGVGSLVLTGAAVALDGAIGAATPVGSVGIVTEGAGGLSLSQPMTATGSIALASGGDLAVTAPVRSILGDVTFIADAGGISLDSTIYAASTLNLQASGSIAEAATGQIQANTLTLLAGGDATITGSNSIATLGNAQVNSLALSDVTALDVTGAVDTIGNIAIDPRNAPLIIAAGASLYSQAGNIALATEGTSGDIFVQGQVETSGGVAGAQTQTGGTVFLSSAGNTVEEGAGAINALALTGSAGGLVALGGANRVAELGAYTASGGLLLNNTASLEVLGASGASPIALPAGAANPGVISSGGLLNLADTAALTVDRAASISGSVIALGAFGGTLSISGTLAPAGDAYLASQGALSLITGGLINAGGTIRADAGGGASFAQGAAMTAAGDVWIGYGASDIPGFVRLGYTAPTSVTGDITEAATITAGGNVGLSASGTITAGAAITAGTGAAGGSLFLDTGSGTTGDILIGATLTATAGAGAGSGTVFLRAGRNIDETGALIGGVLVGDSGGWADLSGVNRIATLGGFTTRGEVAAGDTTHPAGSSLVFNDDAPLAITAAAYSIATPVTPPGLSASGQLPSPLPAVTQAISTAAITGPGSLLLNAQGDVVTLAGSVSLTSGSFIQIAGATMTQTGVLTLNAPLSLLDISGAPEASIAGLFGSNGAAGIAAFASGSQQTFLNSYETLVASEGVANPASLLQLASLVAPLAGSHVVFAEDTGLLSGTIAVPNLALVSAGGSAALSGSIAGVSGGPGALLGRASFGATHLAFDPALTFDGCPIGAPDCGSITTTTTTNTASPAGGLFDIPLQPQIVTDVVDTGDTTGATFTETTSAAGTTTTSELLPNAGLFRLHTLPLTTDMLGPENILRDRAFDDIDVDRLNTGREDVQ